MLRISPRPFGVDGTGLERHDAVAPLGEKSDDVPPVRADAHGDLQFIAVGERLVATDRGKHFRIDARDLYKRVADGFLFEFELRSIFHVL